MRPPLTVEQILSWADAHHARTGAWPTIASGPIHGAAGETWGAVCRALYRGFRGLPGGDSLPRLLHRYRGKRDLHQPLTVEQVLGWADAHHARTGEWPSARPEPVVGAPGENWRAISQALGDGHRGLPGGDSLAQLLARERGALVGRRRPPLTEAKIVAWARAHRRRTGRWPTQHSGAVAGAPGENWKAIDTTLRHGTRGLAGGDSLARLLARRAGARNRASAPRLTAEDILDWADAHFRRTGRWPGAHSGPVREAPGETWRSLNQALVVGRRGLPGGDSLARLLERCRGVPRWHKA